MDSQQIIFANDRGIEITTSRVQIGRKAFPVSDILEIKIQDHQPNRNLYILIIDIVLMVLLYISFQSIYAPLFVLIISSPTILAMMRAKPHYSLNIRTEHHMFRPILASDRSELEALEEKIQQAVDAFVPADHVVIEEEVVEIPGTNTNFTRTVEKNCRKCDLPLTVNDVVWMDMNTGKCPRCGSEVEITWKRV